MRIRILTSSLGREMESININPTEVKLFKTIQCVVGFHKSKTALKKKVNHDAAKTLCTLLTFIFSEVYSGVFLILLFLLYQFGPITEEGFLISPCYSLELYIQMGIYFIFSFAFSFSSFLSYWLSLFRLVFLHLFFL